MSQPVVQDNASYANDNNNAQQYDNTQQQQYDNQAPLQQPQAHVQPNANSAAYPQQAQYSRTEQYQSTQPQGAATLIHMAANTSPYSKIDEIRNIVCNVLPNRLANLYNNKSYANDVNSYIRNGFAQNEKQQFMTVAHDYVLKCLNAVAEHVLVVSDTFNQLFSHGVQQMDSMYEDLRLLKSNLKKSRFLDARKKLRKMKTTRPTRQELGVKTKSRHLQGDQLPRNAVPMLKFDHAPIDFNRLCSIGVSIGVQAQSLSPFSSKFGSISRSSSTTDYFAGPQSTLTSQRPGPPPVSSYSDQKYSTNAPQNTYQDTYQSTNYQAPPAQQYNGNRAPGPPPQQADYYTDDAYQQQQAPVPPPRKAPKPPQAQAVAAPAAPAAPAAQQYEENYDMAAPPPPPAAT